MGLIPFIELKSGALPVKEGFFYLNCLVYNFLSQPSHRFLEISRLVDTTRKRSSADAGIRTQDSRIKMVSRTFGAVQPF